jgi:hypothetical protein
MSYQVYPSNALPGLAFPQKWSPRFFNNSATAASGASVDVGIAQYPLHTFELTYEVLRDFVGTPTEFRNLMAFFVSVSGTLGRFLYLNPDDNAVTAGPIGTGNGTTVTFPIITPIPLTGQPMGPAGLVPAITALYFNGVAQSSSLYTLNNAVAMDQTITFGSAPGAGVIITADYTFYYYCKFAEDIMTFEKFSNQRWSVAKVTLQSCRYGA